jgi:ubiquinone/menaquinone biosynthesis C-methylase UbiE
VKEQYWSRFSKDYDARQARVVGAPLIEAIFTAIDGLSELGAVVELGCGTGYFTKRLLGKAASVLGTDLSEEQLQVAEGKFEGVAGVRFEKQDCTKTTLDSHAFDTVFVANLLHVIEDPAACLTECARLLKEGGLLVVVSFTVHGMSAWEKVKLSSRFFRTWGPPPENAHMLSPERLRTLLEEAGFQVDEARLLGNTTKAVFGTARKPTGDEG